MVQTSSSVQEKTFTPSEITGILKRVISDSGKLNEIWVSGEITNRNYHAATGGLYFSLKDETSKLDCVFFQFETLYKGPPLKDGTKVTVLGSISIFEKYGNYKLRVKKVIQEGLGDLFQRLEETKKRLREKGIFDPSHKKPIPFHVKRLGIVTSPDGAAVNDILRVSKERYPNVDILVAPCLVQGEDSAPSIVLAIEALNDPIWEVDVIIAGRGGGSMEDLMGFNTEPVVMAFYNSRVPIVSAVGHETDSVLTDFVADASFPTPTAAANGVVLDANENLEYVHNLVGRMKSSLVKTLNFYQQKLNVLQSKSFFTNPVALFEKKRMKLKDLNSILNLASSQKVFYWKEKFGKLQNLDEIIKQKIEFKKNKLERLTAKLEALSPLSTLARGYSVVRKLDKTVVTDPEKLKKKEELEIILHKGRIKVEVNET